MAQTRRVKEHFRQFRTALIKQALRMSEKFGADVYLLVFRNGRWYSYRALNGQVRIAVFS